MNDVFVDLVLAVPPDPAAREMLSFRLNELGFTGWWDDGGELHCYVPKGLESIQPFGVSEKIVVTPSWHLIRPQPGRVTLVIDPKMSFGTGYHESTRLALRMLEQCVTADTTVLDIGTGSGILAIAAIKLGAKSAVAIDVDKWACVNAAENAARNGVDRRIDIRHGSVEMIVERDFGLVLANITRNTIIGLLPSMLDKLAVRGSLLLSGLLTDDRCIVENELLRRQCTLHAALVENEWLCIIARPAVQ